MNNNWFKKLIYTLAFLFISLNNYAQIGAKVGFNINSFDKWNTLENYSSGSFQASGIELGINYWYGLPKYGIELLPEIVLGSQIGSSINYNAVDFDLKHRFYDFRLNTQFYPFNIQKDCDCPQFGSNKSVGEGFFVYLSPGIRYSSKSVNSRNENKVLLNTGIGLGYDISLRQNVYITPSLGYQVNMQDSWNDQVLTNLNINNESNWSNLNFSIRVTYKKTAQKRDKGLFR